MRGPTIREVEDELVHQNFTEIGNTWARFGPLADAADPIEYTLVTGVNALRPPLRPRGRVVVYQSAAADLFDTGLNEAGFWVLNASAPVTVRIMWF